MSSLKTTAIAAIFGFAALSAVSAAQAAPIVFDFTGSSSEVNLGASHVYTVSGESITAYAASYSGNVVTRGGVLVANNRGNDEQGLGVCLGTCGVNSISNTPEIDYPHELVQLDIGTLLGHGYTSLTVNADSATDGEKLSIYSSTSSSGLGTQIGSITSAAGNVAILQNGNYLNFVSLNDQGGGDVLLHSLTANVPEPVSMALLGVGMVGTGVVARRRRTSAPAPAAS